MEKRHRAEKRSGQESIVDERAETRALCHRLWLREAMRLNRKFVRYIIAYHTAAYELERILEKKRREEKSSKNKDAPPP